MSRRKRMKRWRAKCDDCGKVADIFKEPRPKMLLTPCTRCECETATYVLF